MEKSDIPEKIEKLYPRVEPVIATAAMIAMNKRHEMALKQAAHATLALQEYRKKIESLYGDT